MIDFIVANIAEIGTLIMALIVLIYAIISKQWATVRSSALSMMLSAERLMATEEGKAKMQWVFSIVRDKAPAWIKKFYSEDKLKEVLQKWYEDAKRMIA